MANEVNLLQPLNQNQTSVAPGSGFNDYVRNAFPIFLYVAVALAIIMVAWGGMEVMLSKVPGAKIEGKERVQHALWGLLLALAAWIILQTINPQINSTSLFSP